MSPAATSSGSAPLRSTCRWPRRWNSREPPEPADPGFSSDPSVVLAGSAYYLVTSTFEYLPGIPVYRSTDLVTWTLIGNVITRPRQAPIDDVATGGGVWAPTIRYRDGVF